MRQLARWCLGVAVLGSALLAQAAPKEKPADDSTKTVAELRRIVEKLVAENKELRAEKDAAPRGEVARLLLDRARAAPLDVTVNHRVELGPVLHMFRNEARHQVVVNLLANAEHAAHVEDDAYTTATKRLDAARRQLDAAQDDDQRLRALDEIAKAAMEVRAEVWKRKDAAKPATAPPAGEPGAKQ